MNLYCDTSALIKLYIDEQKSDSVLALAEQVDRIAISRIAWAEAFSAAFSGPS